MKSIKTILILATGLFGIHVSLAQPDAFTVTLDEPTIGTCHFDLYKYNTRSADYEVFLWDGTNLTSVTAPEVRTYRGRITNRPNYKVFAVWYPDNTLYIKTLLGKGESEGFEISDVDINSVVIGVSSSQPVQTPYESEISITSGFSCTYDDFMNPIKGNGDWETMVAMWENAVNQEDYHTARDIGVSIHTGLLVVPTDPSIATTADIFKPGNYASQVIQHPMFWKTTGSGGGAGRHQYCNGANKGGRTSMGRKGFGALPHEFGHTLDMGHYHNQHDAMHSNMFFFGRNTAAIAKAHLNLQGNQCLHNSASNYMDPLHPYVAEDYFITSENTPILLNVLANDTDRNNEQVNIVSFDVTTQNGGTVTLSNGQLYYTPAVDFVGKDYFNYIAGSGSATGYFENYAQVSIEVRKDCNLALRYTFDEQSGNEYLDHAWGVESHKGTLRNTDISNTTTSGILGNAVHFGSTPTGVILSDVLDPLDESMSISLWFKADSVLTSTKQTLFDTGARNTLNRQGLSIYANQEGITFLCQPEALDDAGAILQYVNDIVPGEWYHVSMIINRQNHILEAFVNGVPVSYSPDSNFDLEADHIIKGYPGMYFGENRERFAFSLGHLTGDKLIEAPKQPFYGAIDEFRIYTKALTPVEVQQLYLNPGDTLIGACETNLTYIGETQPLACLLYPNPTLANAKAKLISERTILSIKVFAIDGTFIYEDTPYAKEAALRNLNSGNYLVHCKLEGNKEIVQKWIVK